MIICNLAYYPLNNQFRALFAIFQGCHLDPLLDDTIAFARKLRAAGGDVSDTGPDEHFAFETEDIMIKAYNTIVRMSSSDQVYIYSIYGGVNTMACIQQLVERFKSWKPFQPQLVVG